MIKKIFLKRQGPKSKFIVKAIQFRGQKEFGKGWRRFLKLKKIGGDEGIILRHKVKANEKNDLPTRSQPLT